MKFVILILSFILKINICFKRIFEEKKQIINREVFPVFLENKLKTKKTNIEKSSLSTEVDLRKLNGYKMKITVYQENDTEETKPTELNTIVKLDKSFDMYGEDNKLQNKESFLK
jgi:hypothetical protein